MTNNFREAVRTRAERSKQATDRAVFEALQRWERMYPGWQPTIRNIMGLTGINSTSRVHASFKRFVARGIMERRAVEGTKYAHFRIAEKVRQKWAREARA